MKNLRQSPGVSSAAAVEKKTFGRTTRVPMLRKQETDTIVLNNPKIDRQLLEEHERLVTNSKGVIRGKKQGADYNLAHPLARKDMPTDAYHLGKSMSEVKKS